MKNLLVLLFTFVTICMVRESANAQEVAQDHLLREEVRKLKLQLVSEKQQRVDAELELLVFLNRDLVGRSIHSEEFRAAKRIGLKLVSDVPSNTEVWRTLAHTKALEGLTLAQATEILGPPADDDIPFGGIGGGDAGQVTRKPGSYVWYDKHDRSHVVQGLKARVKDGKLVDWAVVRL